MAFEIDPILVKSFKLTVELLENDDEGTEQLRSLLEETIRTKFGARKVQPIANLAYDDDPSLKRRITSVQDDVPAKKVKINDSPSKSSSSSPVLSSESESSGGDSEDRALEILEDNSCFVCKSSTTSQRNRLVECMDCHNLYHQNCVTPPIEADVGDPRFVWYCHNCSKGTNKLSSSSTVKSTTGGTAGSTNTGSSSNSSGSNNNSGGSSSLTKTSIGKSSSSGSTRSSSGSFSGVNKPFGGKFSGRLFKSGKR